MQTQDTIRSVPTTFYALRTTHYCMAALLRHRVYILSALLALASMLFLVPLIVHAQGFVPLAETPPGSKLGQLYKSGDFSNFINGLFKFAIAIGAIVAVLRLAYAGYLYMGQSDMWSHKGEARDIIKDVTIGLLLLLGIYLILYQINRDILTLNVLKNINKVQQTSGQQSTNPNPAPSTPYLNSDGGSVFNDPMI